jgi:hypothetical protein
MVRRKIEREGDVGVPLKDVEKRKEKRKSEIKGKPSVCECFLDELDASLRQMRPHRCAHFV